MKHKWANVIEAYINGKQIQTRRNRLNETWHDVYNLDEIENVNLHFPNFNDANVDWRIKPKMKKFRCRLALMRSGSDRYYVQGYDNDLNRGIDEWFLRGEDPPEPTFVKWLTSYIEFDVESDENA